MYCRLWEEGKLAREELAKRGVAEFSPFDADSWRSRFEQLGETLPQDSKDWFKVGAPCAATVTRRRQCGMSCTALTLGHSAVSTHVFGGSYAVQAIC